MPEVAANTPSATVAGWLVTENDSYASHDALASIETDKAVVDLNADADGVVLRILAPAGTEVRVGEPIALIGRPGESATDVDAVVASLLGSPSATPPVAAAGAPADVGRARIFASPLARRLANNAGIPYKSIPGTGPGGRIVRNDVEGAIAARNGAGSSSAPGAVPPRAPPPPSVAPEPVAPESATPPSVAPASVAHAAVGVSARPDEPRGGFTDQPHSRMRRAIAARLSESKQTVPHFYLRGSARVDAMLALRAEINQAGGVKVSVNDFILKAAARAHQLVPAMNVLWTDDAIRAFAGVDIGVAVATDTGLVTPVLRSVEKMSLSAVASATRDFAERAREGRLHQHELEGGTSTVTNLGMFGTEEFAAIINPPQSSILAVGAARSEPVANADGKITAASVLRVTLSVDHRAVYGAIAARWMQALVEGIEAPLRILV